MPTKGQCAIAYRIESSKGTKVHVQVCLVQTQHKRVCVLVWSRLLQTYCVQLIWQNKG